MPLTLEELKWATVLALTEPPQRSKPKEEPTVVPYLTFHSDDGEFTLARRSGHSDYQTLEYSTDKTTWTLWNGTDIFSQNKHLYLRGSRNRSITGTVDNYFVLTGTNIHCIGNIETLLDYETVSSGEHPPMDTTEGGCFQSLFRDCTALVEAPDLPATELVYMCYYSMFYGCTGLITPPSLPARALADNCYVRMFSHCTNLRALPKIPEPLTSVDACPSMFLGCTNIKISSRSDSTYKYEFRVPNFASPTVRFMFEDTGGPFTGSPTRNTTYYTDHEPV